ncbi:D-alanyl-D-alanine carboxypeptidase [bacterium]|nr:D-alanyl-D-alanine carboxypeptidase [bacterium]
MKKIFLLFLSLLFLNSLAFAGEIDEYIAKSGIEQKSTVAIYALDSRNKALFKKNHHKLLIPASTLKLLTFGASYLTLKENYKFETAVYRDCDNNFYIKLGADPLLTSGDLLKLFNQIADTKPNNVYIDDTIIDKTPYPEGWMEEDVWPYARAITPYIIDENMFEVLIKRSAFETKVEILQDTPYQPSIINELVLGDKQDYKIQKLYGEDSSIIGLEGTINKDELVKIPVINPQINFQIHVINAMKKAGIKTLKKFNSKKHPDVPKKLPLFTIQLKKFQKIYFTTLITFQRKLYSRWRLQNT